MPYDDIRDSWWYMPGDEEDDEESWVEAADEYDIDPFDFYDECSMCGVERILCDSGRCSHCEMVWNG